MTDNILMASCEWTTVRAALNHDNPAFNWVKPQFLDLLKTAMHPELGAYHCAKCNNEMTIENGRAPELVFALIPMGSEEEKAVGGFVCIVCAKEMKYDPNNHDAILGPMIELMKQVVTEMSEGNATVISAKIVHPDRKGTIH